LRNNVIVATIFTVIGALLISVFSPVFSPLSELIRDQLSGEPNATKVTAATFDSDTRQVTKQVKDNETIASNSIRFNFTGDQESPMKPLFKALFKVLGIEYPESYPHSFQCSLDGAPFEDCVSPKSYGDLATEVGHTFQVRAMGILGNTDKSAYKFHFTTVTSAFVEAVVTKGNSSKEVDAKIKLDYNSNPRDAKTDRMGRFEFEEVGQGRHEFIISSVNDPRLGDRTGNFFVPAGEHEVKKVYDIVVMSDYPGVLGVPFDNATEPNKEFKPSGTIQYDNISLAQESRRNLAGPNAISTKISLNAPNNTLSEIQNVTYFLHPTFKPSNVTADSEENYFSITFTNWGVFDLKAKVYFKDGEIQDLVLPMEEWSKAKP